MVSSERSSRPSNHEGGLTGGSCTKPLEPHRFLERSGKKIQRALKALAGICAESIAKLSYTSIPEGECLHRSGKEGGCAWLFNSAGAMRSERGAPSGLSQGWDHSAPVNAVLGAAKRGGCPGTCS